MIERLIPFELDAIWNHKDIKSLIVPNSYVYLSSGIYFKLIQKTKVCETRKIYMHSKGIKIEGYTYSNYMFSSSSQYKTFCGHSTVTGFYLVKHIEKVSKYLSIDVKPIALGTGTWEYISNTPYFLRNKLPS
jgi:hypothetical protein